MVADSAGNVTVKFVDSSCEALIFICAFWVTGVTRLWWFRCYSRLVKVALSLKYQPFAKNSNAVP